MADPHNGRYSPHNNYCGTHYPHIVPHNVEILIMMSMIMGQTLHSCGIIIFIIPTMGYSHPHNDWTIIRAHNAQI